MFPYQDAKLPIEKRIDDLLGRMTLREKILQTDQYFSGEHIGGSYASTDHCGPCTVQSRIRTLRAAQTELHDTVPLCSMRYAGSLCGDQALVIDDRQDRSLHKLCLHDRSDDFDQRFPGEDYAAFRDSVDITAEVESAQVVKKIFAEDAEPSQIVHIFIRKVQILNVVNDLFQSGHDRISAFVGILPEEHVKDDGLVFLCLKIALHHREFIQIGKQSKILCTHSFTLFSLEERRQKAPPCDFPYDYSTRRRNLLQNAEVI